MEGAGAEGKKEVVSQEEGGMHETMKPGRTSSENQGSPSSAAWRMKAGAGQLRTRGP